MLKPPRETPPPSDQLDFRALFAILWKRRKLIILGTCGVTLAVAVVSLFMPRVYRSEGFYQLMSPKQVIEESKTEKQPKATSFQGIPIPLYKNSSTQFTNPNRFLLIASQVKTFSPKDLEAIKTEFQTAADIQMWIVPVYAYGREDIRQMATAATGEQPNSVIGLNLHYDADSPEAAYAFVNFFGSYVRDCLIYVTLYNYVMDGYTNVLSESAKNENRIFDAEFEKGLNTDKLQDLKAILARYPEAARLDSRQLVSVQDGGDNFLPPLTQIVGVESKLSDIRYNLSELQRTRQQLAVRKDFFSRCNAALEKANEQGEPLFRLLQSIKTELFQTKDLSQPSIKEVYNDLTRDLRDFEHAFYTGYRFISGPTLPLRPMSSRKVMTVLAAFLISGLLLVVSVLAVDWWRKNVKALSSGR